MTCADILAGRAPTDTPVTVKGWVRTRRDSKAGLSFVHVHDGSCFHPVQVVAPDTLANYADEVLHLTAGCAVEATGTIVPSQGKGQPFEMQADARRGGRLGRRPRHLPDPAQAAHARVPARGRAPAAAHQRHRRGDARAAHASRMAIHRFFHEHGFFWVNTPIITAATPKARASCSASRRSTSRTCRARPTGKIDFAQDFFGRETFLTVSGQLNVETYCLALSKVYTFGPTFRAENSNTSRHLAEFWMIEPEIAFADLADDADLAEELLKYIFRDGARRARRRHGVLRRAHREGRDRQAAGHRRLASSCAWTTPRRSASWRSAKQKFEFPVKWGIDLQSEHERYLPRSTSASRWSLMNYPKEIKAFYMRLNDDGRTVAAMDVLAPGIGEIIGGSQREERLDVLDARMAETGLDPEHYGWYRDLRRYGTVPHAGFGLGFERTVAYVTGLANIRDVIPFPRTPGNARY